MRVLERWSMTLWLACIGGLAPGGELRAGPPEHAADASTASDRWVSVSESALADRRGGSASSIGVGILTAETSANRVGDGARTGDVSLSDAAVSDVRGVFVATFNTGNNALVQTNLNVTVRLD